MTIEATNLRAAHERHDLGRGHLDVVNLTGATIMRATFGPGWRWSADVRPLVGTGSCQESHAGYVLAGRLRVRMDDGPEQEFGPGDAHVVSPGHDAWVAGDGPFVAVGFTSTGGIAVGRACRCPCGVEFRVAADHQLGRLVSAIQQHDRAAHGHDRTREDILAELRAP